MPQLDTAAIEARLAAAKKCLPDELVNECLADLRALLDEVRELRQLADDAVDLAADMIGYVSDYFRLKHKHDEALEGLRERLEGRTPADTSTTGDAPDDAPGGRP